MRNVMRKPRGCKKRCTVNNLNRLGHGDVLLLYTDGLIEPLSADTQDQLARANSRPASAHHPRRESAPALAGSLLGFCLSGG
jgi:serine phosphatase RsbU (regulator of sigma subunit)